MSSSAEFDRTLRVVIWRDAFLCAAAAVLAVVVSPDFTQNRPLSPAPGWGRPQA